MFLSIFYVLAIIASSALIRAEDDAWHLDDIYTLVNEELDPIVSPNHQSSHMHKIIGGSRMAAYYNFDEYSAAKCSSLRCQADKSNYWMPSLYVIDQTTSKFVPVPAKIRFYYFLAKSTDNDPVRAFPKGLRMLVGNPNSKAVTGVASFTCQVNSDFSNSLVANDFNFDQDCPYGMKTELYFPPCWNGYDLYKSDGSHMSYPSQGVRFGMCPWTHPIRLPAIQLEYTWYTSNYNPGSALSGNLAWANGDTTGYGVHGDFVNGWDLDVLKRAMNDTSCVGHAAITMSACNTLNAYFDDAAAQACTPELGSLAETFGNADNVPIDRLPGCNPLWGASGSKPTCNPAIAGLSVSALTGTDGDYVASADDQANYVAPTTPGWHNIACLHDVSSISGGVSYVDNAITADSCTSSCLKAGYNYAGTGQVGSWNCVCGTSISSTALYEPGMCTVACPGNSSQSCGGSYRFNIWYAPNGTVPTGGTVMADGSEYLGCYSNPSTASNGLLGGATYSFQSNSMTNEVCVEACGQQGTNWAATTSQRWCYCGNIWNFGTGAIMPSSFCTTPCTGNSTEMCGDYYKSSLYNISSAEIANATGNHPAGYQGCYQDKSGHLALTNNSWSSTTMTPLQCINGCSELGYSNAGVEAGNQCYCGSTVTSSPVVLPASQCQTACTGNSSETCGGSSAMDLYNVAAATDTTDSEESSRPAGYIGCFKDSGSSLAFNNYYSYTFNTMTVEMCKQSCLELGYSYAGVENGLQCRCGNNYPQTTQMVSNLYCTKACAGNSSETCGAGGYLEAYSLANSTSTVTMPGMSTGAYIGCYENSNRGLTNYSYYDNSMTIERCRITCTEFGYSLSGVYLSKYCGCGNAWTGATQKYPASACQYYTCGGNSTEWCGGSSQLALYNTTDVVVTVDKPEGWISCWTDSSSSRALQSYSYSATAMTSKACRTACNNLGYLYASTENGNTCYCGSTIAAGEKAPTSSCATPCTGQTNQTCGGSNFMDLYNATGAVADNGISGYAGCYTDASVLSGASYVSDWMSVDTCNQWCYARGATYSGVRAGNQCKCGTSSPTLVTTLAACANPCSANSAQNCGNNNTIAVYKLADTGIVSGAFPVSSNSSGYVGCYKEGSTRMLPLYSFSTSSMTNDLCISNCKSLGYALAGSEYAEQCYCGNVLNATSGGYKVKESNCATQCAGGTGICGGSGVLSAWSTANATTPGTVVEGYKGCYSIGTFLQAPPLTYNGDYMSTDICRRTCRFSGYSIAGLTNANTCLCSNAATYGAAAAPAICNAPCKGSTNQTCGATSSKALSIFDTTGAGAQTPSGFAANYVGCISDKSPRILPNYTLVNGGMSSDMCRKVCVAAGYNNYGTESKTECYCGATKVSALLLADSYCTSMCPGAPTEACGGGGRLSYYYIDGASTNTTNSSTTAVIPSASAVANATSSAPLSGSSSVSNGSVSGSASRTSSMVSGSASASASSAPISGSMVSSTAMSSSMSSSSVASSSRMAISSSAASSSASAGSLSLSAVTSVGTVPATSMITSTPVGPSLSVSTSALPSSSTSAGASANASSSAVSSSAATSSSMVLSSTALSTSAISSSVVSSSTVPSSAAASSSTTALSSAVSSSAAASASSMVSSSISSSSSSAAPLSTTITFSATGSASVPGSSLSSVASSATSSTTSAPASSSAATSASSGAAASSSPSASVSASSVISSSAVTSSAASSSAAASSISASATSTSSAALPTGTALGCFSGSASSFPNAKMTSHDDITASMCQVWCNANYYTYAGLSGGNSCGCSNDVDALSSASSSSCSTACTGDSTQTCGGSLNQTFSVYRAVAATRQTRREVERPATRAERAVAAVAEERKRRTVVHARRVGRREERVP